MKPHKWEIEHSDDFDGKIVYDVQALALALSPVLLAKLFGAASFKFVVAQGPWIHESCSFPDNGVVGSARNFKFL